MKLKAKINKISFVTPFKIGDRVAVEDTISRETGCFMVSSKHARGWHLRRDFLIFINPPISPLIKLSLEVPAYKLKSYEIRS